MVGAPGAVRRDKLAARVLTVAQFAGTAARLTAAVMSGARPAGDIVLRNVVLRNVVLRVAVLRVAVVRDIVLGDAVTVTASPQPDMGAVTAFFRGAAGAGLGFALWPVSCACALLVPPNSELKNPPPEEAAPPSDAALPGAAITVVLKLPALPAEAVALWPARARSARACLLKPSS